MSLSTNRELVLAHQNRSGNLQKIVKTKFLNPIKALFDRQGDFGYNAPFETWRTGFAMSSHRMTFGTKDLLPDAQPIR
jgi:hypothetical protein